jgi:uncharacterized membrane protein (UPF0136 family)
MPTTYKVAAGVTALYGLLALVGGVMGYVFGNSRASLATGVPSGVLLLVCALSVFRQPTWSLVGAIVVALAVGGFFASKVIGNLDRFSEFLHSSAGPRSLALVVGGILVVVASAIALATGTTPAP